MPERLLYSHLFEGNPFAGTNPHEAFSMLQWGNEARRSYRVDAPEPLVMLGMTKLLKLVDKELQFRDGEAFLAVGHRTNSLYVVPRVRGGGPLRRIPAFARSACKHMGKVVQTDYLSTKGKGRKEVYYYHKHEEPYPSLWVSPCGVSYIRASRHNGKPSYAVGREGIVG